MEHFKLDLAERQRALQLMFFSTFLITAPLIYFVFAKGDDDSSRYIRYVLFQFFVVLALEYGAVGLLLLPCLLFLLFFGILMSFITSIFFLPFFLGFVTLSFFAVNIGLMLVVEATGRLDLPIISDIAERWVENPD